MLEEWDTQHQGADVKSQADKKELFQMTITQVFKSASDERVISEFEIGGADQATPVPLVGDNVRWIAKDKAYAGRVKSRLISYSAPDKIGLDRSDVINITVELSVDLIDR
jgi:hypothetical protein